MTRDDIERMAVEAGGFIPEWRGIWELSGDALQRFASLVAAAEREKVAAWMRSKSYATGHGDTVEDLLKELEWQVAEREREACLALVNQGTGEATSADALKILRMERDRISAAIRARGET